MMPKKSHKRVANSLLLGKNVAYIPYPITYMHTQLQTHLTFSEHVLYGASAVGSRMEESLF